MKLRPFLIFLLLLTLAGVVQGQGTDKPIDLKTLSGKTYKQARVFRVEPDGINYMFAGGMVKIPFTDLPEAIRKQYGYDPRQAEAFARADDAVQAQAQSAAATNQVAMARTTEQLATAEKEKQRAAAFAAEAKKAATYRGIVLSKNDSGITVRITVYEAMGTERPSEFPGGADQTIFLRNYPNYGTVADSDVIRFKPVPAGTVTTVSGRTLHVFDYADPDAQ